jgi:hypothetical protein
MRIYLLISLTFLQLVAFGKARQYTFSEQCRKATEIFSGRVIKMTIVSQSKSDYGNFKTFQIVFITDKVWKGLVQDTMTCMASEGFCPFNTFELGKKCLVYSDSGQIDLESGRSGDLKYDFIKVDTRKLTLRYLFRRPTKLPSDNRLTGIRRTRQPITAAQASARLFLYFAPLRLPGGQADASQPSFARLTRPGGPNA